MGIQIIGDDFEFQGWPARAGPRRAAELEAFWRSRGMSETAIRRAFGRPAPALRPDRKPGAAGRSPQGPGREAEP